MLGSHVTFGKYSGLKGRKGNMIQKNLGKEIRKSEDQWGQLQQWMGVLQMHENPSYLFF